MSCVKNNDMPYPAAIGFEVGVGILHPLAFVLEVGVGMLHPAAFVLEVGVGILHCSLRLSTRLFSIV